MIGAVHGAMGDKVLNTYLNDEVTVSEYGRVFVLLYCRVSDTNGDRCCVLVANFEGSW